MLFNPKWTKSKPPSIVGFRHWLEQQPPTRRFYYYDCNECAVGQYLIACGTHWNEQSAKGGELLAELNRYAYVAVMEGRCSEITAPMVLREMGAAE